MSNDSREHAAHASAADYRFDEDRHLGVFVCKHVAARAPILYVSHDADGDWQFLCGEAHGDAEGARLVCLEQMVAADPTLNELASLSTGQQATRQAVGAAWQVDDPHEQFVVQCVEQFGWCVQSIDAEGTAPAFSYTVGLTRTFQQPELIVFGLPHEAAQRLLNLVGERVREGQRFAPDTRYSGLVEAHDVRFRNVVERKSFEAHLGYALWYYGGAPFALQQLVWPDAEGHFPDGPLAPAWLQRAQPLLD
jgi:hypothetical protein